MNKKAKTRIRNKSKLHILCIQAINGGILQVLTSDDYDSLLVEGMDLAKELTGYWTIFDISGKLIDGNFVSKVNKGDKHARE